MKKLKNTAGRREKQSAISRRGFIKAVGATTAVAMAASVPKLIYQCRNDLKRFSGKNMAFKKVSEDLGKPWFKVWFKTLLANAKKGKIGRDVPAVGPKEARAHLSLWIGASTWNRLSVTYGEGRENEGVLSWNPIAVPPMFRGNPDPNPDPADLTRKVKQMAKFLGANRVGIAKINRKWIYEETCRNEYSSDEPITKKIVFKKVKEPQETETELIIPDSVKYAVVTIIDLNRIITQMGPASADTSAATNMGYSRMGITDIALAEAIRTMGYNAIPAKNGVGMSVPLAIDAGLGQLGRNGLLITPDYGPAVRIGKVLTDMPLIPDKPIDFGVTEFCESCGKCAEHCPGKAISFSKSRTYDPPVLTGNPGALKWYINGKKCLQYWIEAGASCASCQAVCPFTKGSFWGHDVMKSIIDCAPILNPIWVSMDDLFGYGSYRHPQMLWNMEMGPFGIDMSR
ncbi:MAG: reductive dehalogenase [Deltaproteobacteria bacterium]|nr:reductive dehalogenase [Deltaproteobacteria bacterium]